jgi:hypothetical protein
MRAEDIENKFRLECECGNCSIVSTYYPEDISVPEEDVLYIHYEISQWYADKGLFQMIKDRLRLAWSILAGRKYLFYEIGIRSYQLEAYRDFINKTILDIKRV